MLYLCIHLYLVSEPVYLSLPSESIKCLPVCWHTPAHALSLSNCFAILIMVYNIACIMLVEYDKVY